MFGLGPMEMVVIFLVILLIFGAKRIPEIAQGLGKGITEFKKAARDVTNEIEIAGKTPVQPPQQPQVRNELKEQKPSEDSTPRS